MVQRQESLYITERAVFRLTGGEPRLEEIAPWIDPKCDVLERMGFQPIVADDFNIMPEVCFLP
jgi:propionate CoA-transferase